jgi:hypothetical protein
MWGWKQRETKVRLPAVGMLPEAEVDAALADTDPAHALWKAMLSLIQRAIADEVEKSLTPTLPEKETHFALGGARALSDLRNEILDRRNAEMEKRNKMGK